MEHIVFSISQLRSIEVDLFADLNRRCNVAKSGPLSIFFNLGSII